MKKSYTTATSPELFAAPYPVVVMDPKKHELLFANERAIRLGQSMSIYPVRGINLKSRDIFTCHQLFGQETPCIHCPLLTGRSTLIHPKTGETYTLTAEAILWELRDAYLIRIERSEKQPTDPDEKTEPETTTPPDIPSGVTFYTEKIKSLEQELSQTKSKMQETINALEITRSKLENLINSVPGGIGLCRMVDDFPLFIYMSDGISALSGRTPEEYRETTKDNPVALVLEADRPRVVQAMRAALLTDQTLSIAYRVHHKNGTLTWIHLNGHRTTTANEVYVVFSGMSSEARLFQTIARDMAEAIYVIDRSNYDLLYISESAILVNSHAHIPGRKCYQALYGRTEPCEGCLHTVNPMSSKINLSEFERNGRFYAVDICETDWNGVPAYVKYIRDITEIVNARREKDNLERYFHSILQNLPGGAAVIVRSPDGKYTLEYFSDGFARMIGIPHDRLIKILANDATRSVHAPDYLPLSRKIREHLDRHDPHFELSFRLRRPKNTPIWVNAGFSAGYQEDGNIRLYISFTDITREIEERTRLSSKYNEMLMEHYRSPAPDALIIGHGNLTHNRMIEVIDRLNGELIPFRDQPRDQFYDALSAWIVDPDERTRFRESFRSENLLEAFRRGETHYQFRHFMKFPGDKTGRYASIRVQFTAMPDTGDLVGILTISDVTEKTVAANMQRRLADASCETLMDVDLVNNRYAYHRFRGENIPSPTFRENFTGSLHRFANEYVTPRDRALFLEKTDPDYMRSRLKQDPFISFAYTFTSHTGEIRVKRLTVFETDLQLGRVCISMTDITQSVQEQQSLLNIMAYTFELVGLIDLSQRGLTVHSRESILNYQPPLFFDSLEKAKASYTNTFSDSSLLMEKPFRLETLMEMLEKSPGGYEFIVSNNDDANPVYKQINVLWGDKNHNTICIVRADVTGMMLAERETKRQLEDALKLARAANAAKSEFLSSMSHDIRTPMNAIVGMTELALKNPAQVPESLQVIRSSSEHLLNLINDILDMSRIESGKMTLSTKPFSHMSEMQSIVTRTQGLAFQRNLEFQHSFHVTHNECAGDALRIHQILNNLLGNAVKFTPSGGRVSLLVDELEPKNKQVGMYRYIVEDTGIGISKKDLPHLFDPFFRTEESREKRIEGTGLGMSIVKNLVDFMGGAIRVESETGKGTKVTVELPIQFSEAREDSQPNAADETRTFDLGGIHVLLVEDHPVNQLVAKRLLMSMNARVTIAGDGKAGLELFENSSETEFDAICMDLRMPVMDGYESTRRIRSSAHPRARTIPIIAMTANAFADDVQRCFEAGMTDHLSKPIQPIDLFCKLSLQAVAAAL